MKKHTIGSLTLIFTIVFLTVVSIASSENFGIIPQNDNSQNSPPWQGTYRGVLPCADCQGMETELTLNKNKTFDHITRHAGKGNEATRAISGTFSWNKAGTIITLGGIKKETQPTQYQAGENTLTQLDAAGIPHTGELANKYILQKGKPAVEEKFWKLITLYGSSISPETGDRKEHHLMLKAEGNRISGSSGCNTFSGDYILNGENGIVISKLIATKMSCPTMDSEALFMRALEFVDGYTISGDTLQIHKAKATPVAKFVAVYKKQ